MSVSGHAPSIASESFAVCRTPSVQPSVATGTGCWMECGTSEHLTDIGSVKWVCGACNSSGKAIDRQAKDTAGNKEALVELKKNLNECKATVRNNRLQVQIQGGQGNSALARSLHAERAKQIAHSFVTSAEVVSGVSQNTDVFWLDELEYIAYHKFTKGLEHNAATVSVYVMYLYIYIYIYLSLYICISLYIYICIFMFYMYTCIYVYVCIYIYI